MTPRKVIDQLTARPASDGDGVNLLRVFAGGTSVQRFDPFLMLDEFGSDKAADYIGGFPSHPHRGFETVTYMLQGKMEHRDHMGNVGLLTDGGVQWMTAGRGVIHSEMPKQTEGHMHGFQLWVNLPASQKMKAASYTDVPAAGIPIFELPQGAIKAIAGSADVDGRTVSGFFDVPDTQVLYLDISLNPGQQLTPAFSSAMNTLAYVYEGQMLLGEDKTLAATRTLSHLSAGDSLNITNPADQQLRLLLIAGLPLGEPIVQHGPFVMNSREQIEQALRDYQAGTLTD